MKPIFAVLLFLLLGSLAVPERIAAQTSTIDWTVEVGFNGSYKTGAWIPITVDVTNNGNDMRGRLEWRWSTTSAGWGQEIDLPRGAQKRVVLPVAADAGSVGSATLQLLDGERVVLSERIRSTQIDVSRAVVGVLSSSSNALAALGGMYANFSGGTVLIRLDSAALPDRSEMLQTFDVLFVHDADTSAWTDAQRSALMTWVAEGGRLIVGGDRTQTAAGIGAIAAATVGDKSGDVPLSALSNRTKFRAADANASIRALALTPAADAHVVIAAPDGAPLIVRRSYGSGQVLQTAFNLESLSVAGETVEMWEQLLPWSEHSRQWFQLRGSGESMLRQGLNLPGLSLPSLWLLIGFLASYIGLVGPANYLILRRLDRREWAYITIPLTVLIFTLGAYLLGASGRGGSPTVTALSVVRAIPGTDMGHARNYLGVFSPVRRVYEVELPSDALVSNPFSVWTQGEDTLPVVRTESSVTVPNFLIDVGALRPVLVEMPATAPRVELSFQRDGEAIIVDVQNTSNGPLEDVAMLVGENLHHTENLVAGERRSIRIDDPNTFQGAMFTDTSRVRRGNVVDAFRWSFNGQPMVEIPNDFTIVPGLGDDGSAKPAVSLMAWADGTPQQSITLDGTSVAVNGETLFIWPVREVQP